MGDQTKYCYSSDGERFYDDESSAIDGVREYGGGSEIVVWVSRGVASRYKHIEFINANWVIENMQEAAYERAEEHSDDYLKGLNKSDAIELEELIANWANKKHGKIGFYSVDHINHHYPVIVGHQHNCGGVIFYTPAIGGGCGNE